MKCVVCREALSARLDGEREPATPSAVDDHVKSCAACESWWTDATALTRSLRVRPVVATPDLVESVIAAAPAIPTRWGPRRNLPRVRWSQVALGLVAIAQVALGLAQVFGVDFGMKPGGTGSVGISGETGMSMSAHLFNESTAWNLAIGLGLLWAAARPRAASGMLPVLGVFIIALSVFVFHDLLAKAVTVDRVASHGLLVAGLVLLVVVHRRHGSPPIPSPGPAATAGTDDLIIGDDADVATGLWNGRPRAKRSSPLRPASRHVA